MPSLKKETDKSSSRESCAFVMQAQSLVETVEPGIKRQLLGYNEQIMAVRVWFEEGAVGALHNHPHSQVAYVESGEFEVTIGEETKMLAAGDCYFAAPSIMHGAICRKSGVLIDMFSPLREDFLPTGEQL